MADILSFDPGIEFEILDTFDFEEEIQRPENLRFFTLEEQLFDYFEKRLPKGKIEKAEIKRLSKEIDRFREVYTKTITVTDSDYKFDLTRTKVDVPWINEIYEKFELSPYSFSANWTPLFERSAQTVPNAYPRMITALPKPYKTVDSDGLLIEKKSILVDQEGKNPIVALGNFERSKTVIHDDGSVDVISVPIGNTSDDIRAKGFYIQKRNIDIPNPLADHPFLASNGESSIITEEKLVDIFPTIETILTHAVPTTTDPYSTGMKYLKIYDVNLDQISWDSWKQRFPPVQTITVTPNVQSLTFPSGLQESTPSEFLTGAYTKEWLTGIASRSWLLSQEDGGLFMNKMLLSKASEAGLLPVTIIGEQPEIQLPLSTPEECLITDTFENFIASGVYRSPDSKQLEKGIRQGNCVPVGFYEQEKFINANKRIPWKEDTEQSILQEHRKLLKKFQYKPIPLVNQKFEKNEHREESEMRKHVVSILNDETRTDIDKVNAIDLIIQPLQIANRIFLDIKSSFVICQHSLSILRGDLSDDRLKFYNEWTTIQDGYRVCKYCSEQINDDVFLAQEEYDSDGHLVVSADVLVSEGIYSESETTLQELRKLFILDNVGEQLMYLLISMLQVFPEGNQLIPILQTVRSLTQSLRKNTKISNETKNRIEGIVGIAGTVILMQTHTPFLISRRSFGSKILKMSGYPRDSDNAIESPIINTFLFILKTTFDAFPGTFKGPISQIINSLTVNTKKVKEELVTYMNPFIAKFKPQLEEAKQRYMEVVPEQTIEKQRIEFPLIHLEKVSYNLNERLSKDEAIANCKNLPLSVVLEASQLPSVSQMPLLLPPKTETSNRSIVIESEKEEIKTASMNEKDIRKNLSIGLPKVFSKIEKLKNFLTKNKDPNAILTILDRCLDELLDYDKKKLIEYRNLSVYLKSDKSVKKDIALGLLYELLSEVSESPKYLRRIESTLKKDPIIAMVLIQKDEAETEYQNLRTQERETLKKRLRSMNDTEREITKTLLEIGISSYIITNVDRELFAREYKPKEPENEKEPDVLAPEEGYNDTRDYVENGDVPLGENGQQLEVDYGDYGDRAVRDYDDYGTAGIMDDGEGYGN